LFDLWEDLSKLWEVTSDEPWNPKCLYSKLPLEKSEKKWKKIVGYTAQEILSEESVVGCYRFEVTILAAFFGH
jgi:hypothetical protein